MIIGIDGNEANVPKKVGIGQYGFELLKQFKEYQVSSIKYQVYLKHKPNEDLPKEDNNWQYLVFGPKPFWTQLALPVKLYMDKPRPSVFFSPTHYAPRFSPIPVAISIMDVSYLHFPQLFKRLDLLQLSAWTRYSVRLANRVFTISEASKNDIINAYNIPQEKIIVTYPGIKKISNIPAERDPAKRDKYQISNVEDMKNKYGIKTPFILFVGTIQPRKNISRLIEAFSRVTSVQNDIQLVIVGKKGWLYEEIFAAPKKFGIEEKVLFLEFVSEEELSVLYQHAIFFILPSLYEGFGLPVLEAMKHGCPVITSNTSSLPEAGGDAALYVNPDNVDDIAEKMKKLASDEKMREELKEKGYKQIKKFSWEKTAEKTHAVLKEIASK